MGKNIDCSAYNLLRSGVGIDVGGTFIKAGLVKDGKIVKIKKVKTKSDRLPEIIIIVTKELGGKYLGVGVPGLVDKNGTLFRPPNLPGIEKLPLKKILEDNLKIPVRVENDVNLVALGEWKYGAGRGVNNLLVMTLGTGIGGGIIANGELYRGKGFAGEIGHITIDPDGPLCRCGNYGCLESFVGGPYIVEKAERGIKNGIKTTLAKYKKITPEIISKTAYQGDKYAKNIVNDMGEALGIGIATLCATLDPERVVIGGGIAGIGELLFDKIKRTLKKRLYTRKEVDIRKSELGDKAGILGAVSLF